MLLGAAAPVGVAQAGESVVGREYVQLIQQHLHRLHGLYPHPNRVLHLDNVLVALLISFYDPSVRSLRSIEDQSQLEQFSQHQPIDRLCRSTLSDALRQMNPQHLLPIIKALRAQVPTLCHRDASLNLLLKRIVAADGSIFTIPSDVLWGIALSRSNGKPGRQVRLNLQLDVLQFLPIHFSLSGHQDGSESAAFMRDLSAGVIYACDRNFVDFDFIRAVFNVGSDLVVRLKSDTRFVALRQQPLTEADRAANVVSDAIGHLPGSAGSPGFGSRLLREVVVYDGRKKTNVRLLCSLLELDARTVGLIYRQRWMIELFFKWLKCVARLRRFISQSQNGMTVQLYVAVIALLLIYLRTGRRPSLYASNCMAWVASGQMSVEKMLQVLARREHERDLERARLARKREAAEKNPA